jgi:hypothetical protein
MARSYHVTKKTARAALARGDTAPTEEAGAKSWAKKMVKKERIVGKRFPDEKRSIHRDIASRAKWRRLLGRRVRLITDSHVKSS